jgi:hypothetical protein
VKFTSLSPIESLYFLDPRSTMISTIPAIESNWNSLLSSRLSQAVLETSSTMICILSSIESNWNSLLSSSDISLCFLDQSSTMFWPIFSIWSKWNSRLSPWLRYLSFLDTRSTISAIENEWNSRLSPRLNSSFQDQSSILFRTVSPIKKWVKFACRSPRQNLCVFWIHRRDDLDNLGN